MIEKYNEIIFERIKRVNELSDEYWSARELQHVLGYKEWRNFEETVARAKTACEKSGNLVRHHFVEVNKIVKTGVSEKEILDYHLSRYACYLIVQNGDSRKEVIALAQTYFAIQTRKQELTEKEYELLSEDERRLYKRKQTKGKNFILYQAAKEAGVKNFDKFTNEGYKGLYDGETADDIAKRKKLRYREEILDAMGSEELSANEFRISQTEAKLKKEDIKTEGKANQTHYKVGKAVRNAIKEIGGTMPEDLPKPDKSLKELEKKEKAKNKLLNQ